MGVTAFSRWTRGIVAAALGSAGALVAVVSLGSSAGAVSPGYDGQLAYNHGTTSVQTATADGNNPTDVGTGVGPSYMADGSLTYIASGSRMVTKVALDGTKTPLFAAPGTGIEAAASPDGTRFLLGMGESANHLSTIGVINADGTNLQEPFTGDAYNESEANWFPDGQHIVFVRYSADFSASYLYTAKADGTELTQIPVNNGAGYGNMGGASVSPDGTKIVYSVFNSATQYPDIAVVNVDGTNVVHMATPNGGGHPTFSPAGTRIAFEGVNGGIYEMNADGWNPYQVTMGADTYPVWQPLVSPPVTIPPNMPPRSVITIGRVANTRTLQVSAARSTDGDGSIQSWAWYWGDNTPATKTANASHTYAAPGLYRVKLTVTDNDALTSTSVVWVRVANDTDKFAIPPYTPPAPVSPTPGYNLDPRPVITFAWTTIPHGIYGSAVRSYDPDGTIVAYHWNWGDGTVSGTKNAAHAYAAAGTHHVLLLTADNSNPSTYTISEVWIRA